MCHEVPISTRLNNQSSAIITNGDQETKRGFPKESLNRVQDVVEDLTANETNENINYKMKSLWRELEEKILSGSLTIPEIIDLLGNKIFKEEIKPSERRAAHSSHRRAIGKISSTGYFKSITKSLLP